MGVPGYFPTGRAHGRLRKRNGRRGSVPAGRARIV